MGQIVQVPGFIPAAPTKQLSCLVISVCGHEKSGKTHFALTAPGPMAFLNFDVGIRGVIDKFLNDKQIVHSVYTIPKADQGFNWIAAWNKFMLDLGNALTSPVIKTVVIDTMTEVWELLRLARLGKLTQVRPFHYAPVNSEMEGILHSMFDSGKNVILVHKMRPTYVNDNWNGKYERAGYKNIGYKVEAEVEMSWDSHGKQFVATIIECRHRKQTVVGLPLIGDLCSFPMLFQVTLG